jgi:hypothetical protein
VDGFSLHAGVTVAAEDRAGLERLCRYGLRPSFALERLSLLEDGRVRYRLKRPWPRPGGITERVMDPVDFLARLTSLIPTPRANMCRYHVVFAPASPLRGLVSPRQLKERDASLSDNEPARSCKHGESLDAQDGAVLQQKPRAERKPTSNPSSEVASRQEKAELRYLLGPMPAAEELLPLRQRRRGLGIASRPRTGNRRAQMFSLWRKDAAHRSSV